jgi:hypothetical protein
MKTPECDKVAAAHEKSQLIGEFIDEFLPSKGIVLAKRHEHSDGCYADDDPDHEEEICGLESGDLLPSHCSVTSLLAEFFKIDLDKVEAEKRKILEDLRSKK